MSRDLNISKSQPWRRLYFVSLTARPQTFPIPVKLKLAINVFFFLAIPAFLTLLIFKYLFLAGFCFQLGEIISKTISKPPLTYNAELLWMAGIISPSSSHSRVCSELLASRATAVCLLSCLFVEKHLCSHSLIDKWVLPYVKSDLIQMPFLIGMLTTQDISKQ